MTMLAQLMTMFNLKHLFKTFAIKMNCYYYNEEKLDKERELGDYAFNYKSSLFHCSVITNKFFLFHLFIYYLDGGINLIQNFMIHTFQSRWKS